MEPTKKPIPIAVGMGFCGYGCGSVYRYPGYTHAIPYTNHKSLGTQSDNGNVEARIDARMLEPFEGLGIEEMQSRT